MNVQTWLDTVDRNTPEGFPYLAPGWPYAEHGITHSAYIGRAIMRLEGLDDGADIPQFQTFENWRRDQLDKGEELDNLGFSWKACDLCGGLAGDHYAVTALPKNPAETHDYVALSVCGDCLGYIANGDVPDWLEGGSD